MVFCDCGSLMVGNNCTNKKCQKHKRVKEKITAKKISTIIELLERLDRDYNESELRKMSIDDAQRFIGDLVDEIEEKGYREANTKEIELEEAF